MKLHKVRHLAIVLISALAVTGFASPNLRAQELAYWAHEIHVPARLGTIAVESVGLKPTLVTTNSGSGPMFSGSIVTEPDEDRLLYIYDHSGCVDPDSTYADRDPNSPLYDPNPTEPIPGKVWTLNELVGPDWLDAYPSLNSSKAGGPGANRINSTGLVVGVVWDSTVDPSGHDTRLPVYLDLTDPVLELKMIPTPWPITENDRISQLYVSDAGDIHVRMELSGTMRSFLYKPARNGEQAESIQLPDLGLSFRGINGLRQLIAEDRNNDVIIRYTVTDLEGNGDIDEIPTVKYSAKGKPGSRDWTIVHAKGPNNFGQFTAELHVNEGNDHLDYIVRYGGAPGNLTEERRFLLPFAISTFNGPPNDSGDTAFSSRSLTAYPSIYHFHEGAPTNGDEVFIPRIEDLIIPDSKPAGLTTTNGFHDAIVSNRDSNGYGWIVGYFANDDTVSGRRPYLLEPIVPSAEPGIIVDPVANLITSESGDTANFDVSLNTEPTADVTFGVSSSNTDEGMLEDPDNPAGPLLESYDLVFDATNWDEPQTVTVVGVDDAIQDGEVEYTIVSAAATSNDPDYDGLDADDVSVTNLDDDGPPGGGSETYDSADTPLSIPDNNSNGIASNILAGDHLITNLNVNIDISHGRPSDLDVYLIAPDNGPPIQLFNLSGDNNVPDFNGTSSLGLWTLEVYDTRKKKTGTLSNWSITIDY